MASRSGSSTIWIPAGIMKVATLVRYQPAEVFSPSLKARGSLAVGRFGLGEWGRDADVSNVHNEPRRRKTARSDRPMPPIGRKRGMNSLSEQLVGSWTVISHESVRAEGTRVPVYGVNPKGIAMFDAGLR